MHALVPKIFLSRFATCSLKYPSVPIMRCFIFNTKSPANGFERTGSAVLLNVATISMAPARPLLLAGYVPCLDWTDPAHQSSTEELLHA